MNLNKQAYTYTIVIECLLHSYLFSSFLWKVTGDHTESQILLGLELYKARYDYVYELLFALANFHSPVVDTEQGLEVWYSYIIPYSNFCHIVIFVSFILNKKFWNKNFVV